MAKRNWTQYPTEERRKMIEDVAAKRVPVSFLLEIPGLNRVALSNFISNNNRAERERGGKNILPGLVELKRIHREEDEEGYEAYDDNQKPITGEPPPPQRDHDKPMMEVSGNEAFATLSTRFLEHLEEGKMLKDMGIDPDDWVITNTTLNCWQNFFKQGSKESGQHAEIVHLYQRKMHLRRRRPEIFEWPLISPIQTPRFDFSNLPAPKPKASGVRKCLIIPDTQCGFDRDRRGRMRPFHDRRAMDIVWQIAAKEQPESIVLIGDHCDLAEWSDKFVRKEGMYFTTQPMLLELNWWLTRLRMACPHAEIVYIEGNHEIRLKNAMLSNMVAAMGLQSPEDFQEHTVPNMSLQRLLGLDNLGISYLEDYPNGEYWINDNIRAEHGCIAKNGAGETTRSVLQRMRASTIIGHIHRREVFSKNEYRKGGFVSYIAECFGCLCHLDGRVPAASNKHDWNQGFGIVHFEPGNGAFRTEHIPIFNGRAIFDGMVFQGFDPAVQIDKDLGLTNTNMRLSM